MNVCRASARRLIVAICLLLAAVTISACASAPAKPRILGRGAAKAKVKEFFGRGLKLKVLSLTKFPTGPGYEIKQVGGPAYFVVDARTGEVDYAMLEEIREKTGGVRFNVEQARRIARRWASKHPVFTDFRYVEKQYDSEWPKRGYYTTVWAGRAPARDRREFAKVTVDLATGKVVSTGMGDPKWTMFCLPPGMVKEAGAKGKNS